MHFSYFFLGDNLHEIHVSKTIFLKNKKNIINLYFADFTYRIVKVN